MSRAARSAIAAFVLLLILGLLLREDPRRLSTTSFGKVPSGHGALYDLLLAIGLPVGRSYDSPDLLPAGASIWWIEPGGLCDPRPDPDEESGEADEIHEETGLHDFMGNGGTALVFLAARPTLFETPGPGDLEDCSGLAGIPLPDRLSANAADDEAEGPEPGPEEPEQEHWPELALEQVAEGKLVPESRLLTMPHLARFREAGLWTVRLRLDGLPFVLEQDAGSGRIVAVADASFLRNAWLDRGDAAPLALDFVRFYGLDAIDERQHGLRLAQGSLRYLARSPALAVFVGLVLMGLLVFWRGTAIPPALFREPSWESPTLEEFVDSLATLYARTRDHGRVAERYRELTVARLRRHFGLPPGTPTELLVGRLRREGRLSEEQLGALPGPASASRETDVRACVQRFDAIVEEVCS